MQTSYSLSMSHAVAGLVADINPRYDSSKSAEGVVKYGFAVGRGTASNQVKAHTSAGSGTVYGIAARTDEKMNKAYTESEQYDDTDTVHVIEEGYIYVPILGGGAASAGSSVNRDVATGQFTMAAVSGGTVEGTGNVVLEADFDGTAGAIVKVFIEKKVPVANS